MYIGNNLQVANPSYKIIDDISSGFNGSATSFALQVNGQTPVPFPISTQQVMISVNGVVQEPDPSGSAGFKLLGSNIVFSSAPANGHAFFGTILAGADYVTAGSEFPDGSATAPSFTFQDDQDTGWYRSGSGAVGYSANGVQTFTFDGNGLTVTTGNVTIPDKIIHSGDTNTSIRFPAADTFAVETSGSERLRLNSTGQILVGTTSDGGTYDGVTPHFVSEANSTHHAYSFVVNSTSAGHSGILQFVRSRGTSDGSNTIVQDGDRLGSIYGIGADGTNRDTGAAAIDFRVDGTPGENDMPGRIEFRTTADGASSPAERLRIDSSGRLLLGTTTEGVSTADDLTIATAGVTGITIRSGTSSDGNIYFSDGTSGADEYKGYVQYSHTNNSLAFGSNATTTLTLDSSQNATFAGNVNIATAKSVTSGAFQSTGSTALTAVDSGTAYFGTGLDLRIYHDGNSYVTNNTATQLAVQSDDLKLRSYTDLENYLVGTHNGSVDLYYNGVKKLETSNTGVTVTGTVSDSKGNLRHIPRELKSSAYTLVLADSGKTIATNSGVTVPHNVLGTGDAVTIVNNSGSDITITQASSLSIYNAADASTGNRTLAGRGMATIWFSSGSEAYISGAGLS